MKGVISYANNNNIPFYSIAIFLALISNIIFVFINSQKYKNFNNREIIGLLIYVNVGIIFGAKILSYILSYEKLGGKFNFINLGLTSYGAVTGAILFSVLFAYQFKKTLNETINLFLPSIPLMYSIGKLGCFLAGCCYGIEYNGFGKIIYKYSSEAPNNIYLFPVQLAESILFFLIFIYIRYKSSNKNCSSNILSVSFILCGITKFLLDFLRMSHKNMILSINQYISIIFIVIGLILYFKNKKELAKRLK